MARVSIIGSFIDVINAFSSKSEGNEIRTIVDNRESILKKYGDKRLLVKTMSEKEFERVSNDKEPTGIRARIKSSGGANGGKEFDGSMEGAKQTNDIDNDIDRGEK